MQIKFTDSVIKWALLTLFSFSANGVLAGEPIIGDKLVLGDTLSGLQQKISSYCASIKLMDVAQVVYPLAEHQEQHLICHQYNKDGIHFDKVAFVLADDHLTQMEANGVNSEVIKAQLGEPMAKYLGMEVYAKGRYWIDSENQRFLWVVDEAMQPNLFTWHNRYLDADPKPVNVTSTRLPDLINFNADIAAARTAFRKQCRYFYEEKVEDIWLANKPKDQVQLNCFGIGFAGFERKFEAVFGDGKLQVVWVLTAKEEEARIRQRLLVDWGKAEIVNPTWEVFGGGKISLRLDKPELLILSDEIIPYYQDWFHQKE